MKKGGFMPFDEAQKIIESKKQPQKYEISKKALAVIHCAKNSADRKGKVHLSDRLIDGMKEVGVNFDHIIPQHYTKGGFE